MFGIQCISEPSHVRNAMWLSKECIAVGRRSFGRQEEIRIPVRLVVTTKVAGVGFGAGRCRVHKRPARRR
jgi:hypothetical protein